MATDPNATAAGWDSIGNNLYKNSSNGQVVDYNHPIYQQALAAGTTPAPAAPSPNGSAPVPPLTNTPTWTSAAGDTPNPNPAPAPPPTGIGSTDPFAASGGGQFINGGWIPNSDTAALTKAGGTAAPPPGTTPAAPTPGSAPGTPQGTVDDTYRQQLLSLMGRYSAPVSPTDPAIAAQTNAYSAARQMAQREEQAGIAEQAGARGLATSGAADAETQGSQENMGRDIGQNAASTIGTEITNRRNALQQVLTLAGNSMSDDEKNALQLQIAQLDDATKRYGIDSSAALGQGQLSLQGELGRGGLSLSLLEALMNNQNQENSMGLNYAQLEALLNQNAATSMFG